MMKSWPSDKADNPRSSSADEYSENSMESINNKHEDRKDSEFHHRDKHRVKDRQNIDKSGLVLDGAEFVLMKREDIGRVRQEVMRCS